MPLTKQDIYSLLGLELSALDPQIYHDSSGPGYLDSWLLLARDEHIWQHVCYSSGSKKKQIIVSEPILGRGPVSLFELEFFAALIANFDVYFWPDNNGPFREARPLTDPTEFWDNKPFQPFVATQRIIESLVTEGLSLDNVMIIDFEAYRQITARAQHLYVNNFSIQKHLKNTAQGTLNLTHVKPSQYHELADCADPLTIQAITVNPVSGDALNTIVNLFPNLERLEVRYANAQWVLNNIKYLRNLNLTLSHFMPERMFELPASTSLNTLVIRLAKNIIWRRFSVASGAQVHTLELQGFYGTQLFLGELHSLRTFILKNSSILWSEERRGVLNFMPHNATIKLPSGLEDLRLEGVSMGHGSLMLNDYIASNPSLRSLSLHFDTTKSLLISLGRVNVFHSCLSRGRTRHDLLRSLENFSLSINRISDDTTLEIDLSSATSLKRLSLPDNMNLDAFNIPPAPGLSEAEYPPDKGPRHRRTDAQVVHYREQPGPGNCRNALYWKEKYQLYRRLNLINEHFMGFSQVTYLSIANLVFASDENDFIFRFIGPKLRFLNLYDVGKTTPKGTLTLDFSACSQLESLAIRKLRVPLILNLTGAGALRFLDIQSSKSVQINYDQEHLVLLEHLRISADNASMLRGILSYDLAPDCIRYFSDSNNHSFSASSSAALVSRCHVDPLTYRLLATFSLSAVLLLTLGLLLDYYYFLNDHADSHNHEPSTLPQTETSTTTSTLSTTTASTTAQTGVNAYRALDVWHIVLACAAGAGLMAGLAGLLYCIRARLNSGSQRSDLPVPRFEDVGYQVDTDTAFVEDNINIYPMLCNVYPDEGQIPGHVRIFVKNRVMYTQGKLFFSTSTEDMRRFYPLKHILEQDDQIRHRLMQRVSQDNNSLIYIKGSLAPGVFCPLPGWYPLESEEDFAGLYAEEPDLIDCHYHERTQQVFITWSSAVVKPKEIQLFFEVRKKPFYTDLKNTGRLHQVNPQLLLPEAVRERIYDELHDHPVLGFVFDETHTLEYKIRELTTYFRAFTVAPLTDNAGCQLSNLLTIIKEGKGVCRHRSQGFMLLSHFLGCPVDVVANTSHMFCAIPWQNETHGWNYKRLDLSLTSDSFGDDNVFWQIERNIRENQRITLESIRIDDPEDQMYFEHYQDQFKQFIRLRTLDSLAPLFNERHTSPPLVILNALSPYVFNAGLVRYLEANGVDTLSRHLFIDSPNAFLRYLKPFRIKAGQIVEKKNGPLRSLLQTKHELTVLVIDWTPFTHAQRAGYQTLMDRPRMLFIDDESFYLPKNLLVVSLIGEQSLTGTAFLSRMQPWDISSDFARQLLSDVTSGHAGLQAKPIEKYLFASPGWREVLLGRVDLSPGGLAVGEGALSKAIRQGRALRVYSPPEDPAFALLQHQINEEKKYLCHETGRMKAVSASVRIDTCVDDGRYLCGILATSALRVYVGGIDLLQRRTPIYIGMHNLHELYNGLQIDGQGQVHSLRGGLLDRYEENRDIFYLVDSMAKSYWESLLEYCGKQYPGKPFEFLLSPGSQIEGYATSARAHEQALPPQDVDFDTRIFSSSDPDYLVQRLAASLTSPWVVYVHKATHFNELIAVVHKEKGSINRFVYQRKAVLEALLQGQSVILNGELSLALYFQLLSLCASQSHVFSNGQRLDVTGRLYLVLPADKCQHWPHIQRHARFTMADYQQNLPYPDSLYAQQIQAFYRAAIIVPHAGRGRPESLRMNHARFTGFLAALEEGGSRHRHNPVKGLFLYDYPRRSEEQACLNVLGKYYFRPDDRTSLRTEKLAQLRIKTMTDLRRSLWTVLNCFNGLDLHSFLGPDLAEVVYQAGMPGLRSEALERLFEACQLQPTQDNLSEHKGVAKNQEQLRHFLQDPRQKILMLKGEPGVGKTWSVKKLIGNCYMGDADIGAWLSDGRNSVWLCDEANMLPPDALDALIKGLCSGQETILYRGQVYRRDGHDKKMILTGNPESFPGRYYHSAIQDYANTVYFEKPGDAFLTRHAQGILPENVHAFIPVLLEAYHLISRYNPYLPTSIRDMESLAQRFAHLYRIEPAAVMPSLLRACVSEFACSIKDEAKRRAFISELEEKTGQRYQLPYLQGDALIPLTPTVSTTREKAYIIDTLLMNLHMRFESLVCEAARARAQSVADKGKGKGKKSALGFFSEGKPVEHKRYLILQGEPGLGKSTLLRAVLTFYLNRLSAEDGQGPGADIVERELNKAIYLISGDSSKALGVLTRAMEDEAFVILDESNINPSLEALLLDYLTATDKPGFMVLGSENDGAQGGRLERSPAELNRSQLFYFPAYGKAEYIAFAKAACIRRPEAFVRAYMDLSRETRQVGARHFFKCLKAEKERQEVSIPSIESDSSDADDRPFLMSR
ncbi:hypothetical protein [Legionella sp. CNM-4043-24]|uniref:hypothetical protein n=1 Tax=Legionella sp. CNM-4043-24 TaxID=3421646 RepID=UPI00403A886C